MVSAEVGQPPGSMLALGLGLTGALLLRVGGENGIGLLMLLTAGLLGGWVEPVGELVGELTGTVEAACGFWVQPASSSTAAPAAASLVSTMGYLPSVDSQVGAVRQLGLPG